MTTLAPARPPVTRSAVGRAPMFVVLAGTLVTFLDFFIVNVALPAIGTDLHAGTAALSLVVAGYGLTFAAGMITGGRLGDLYGRRRTFVVGLVLFTVTSALCGIAPNAGTLVVARLLQGAAGAVLTPQVLAILGTVYEGERRNRAFAAYGFTMGIAAVLGQLLGGALIQADIAGLGWRAIFLINVPVGLATLLFVRRVPESRGMRSRLDLAGTLLGVAAVAALVLPLVEGRTQHWPLWTWLSFAATPVLAAAFLARQRSLTRRGAVALVDLGLFRTRTFAIGSLAAFTFSLVPPSFFFVLALYLQLGRGDSALESGEVFALVGVGYFAAMLAAGPVARLVGHQVLAIGALTVAAGCVALVTTARAGAILDLAPGLVLVGAGIGFVLVPLASTALAGLDPAHAGAASGVLSTAQQVGGALGVSAVSTVFFAAGADVAHAFVVAVSVVGGLTLVTAGLVQALRR